MQTVAGMVGTPGRNRRMRSDPATARRRVVSFLGPVLAATVAAAIGLHLLVELASLLPAADLLGALSVLTGMLVVLVVTMPFTILWMCRAQRVWSGWAGTPGSDGPSPGALTRR